MNSSRFHLAPVCIAVMSVLASLVQAQTAGTVLFAPPGVQIVDNAGLFRDAKKGDVLKPGERLLTPPNTISQVKLPDGGLVGMRPGSVMKFDAPPPGVTQAQQVLSLVQGTVRVVGSELAGQVKAQPLALQTGQVTLQLQGADIESAVVRPESRPGGNAAGSANAPGSYTRLLTGSGSIKSGQTTEPLPVGQVSYVSPNNPAPATLANVAPSVFAPSSTPREGAATNPQGLASPPAGGQQGNVNRTTSTLTAPPALGQGGTPPPAGLGVGAKPPPLFSPTTTSLFPGGASPSGNQPRPGGPGPIAGGPPQIRPPLPPPPRPPNCRPNPHPTIGPRMICT